MDSHTASTEATKTANAIVQAGDGSVGWVMAVERRQAVGSSRRGLEIKPAKASDEFEYEMVKESW